MDWDRVEGNWSELKGQARQKIQKFQVGSLSFMSNRKSDFGSSFSETDLDQENKAAQHLSNLQALLNAMPSANGSGSASPSSEFNNTEEALTSTL